jgi:membrane fusion protein, multidrug efflux system
MKNQPIFLLAGLILLLAGCRNGSEDNPGSGIPESPAERRALLQTKRLQLMALQEEIAALEELLGSAAGASLGDKPKLVTTMVLGQTTFRRFSEIQGNVVPVRMNAISSESGGRLVRVNVKAGDQVRAGQLLAVVDMEPLQKQIQELETALDLARDVYDRQKRLWDQQIGSEIQFLQARNNKDRLEKSIESLRSQLNKASIVAPISGVIEELLYEQGDVAPPGMPIMRLINTRDLKISADVPERYVGTVKTGDKVRVRIPALGEEQEARVSLIGQVVHPSNRTFNLETTLDNSKNALKPNLLALVYVEDYREPNALVISVDLVQQEVGGKKFVFVREDGESGSRARKVYVSTGESYDNTIVIREGLQAGDEIIVRGARGLADNDLLEIQKENNE